MPWTAPKPEPAIITELPDKPPPWIEARYRRGDRRKGHGIEQPAQPPAFLALRLTLPEALQGSERFISVLPDGGVLGIRADFSYVPYGRIDSKVGFGHRALDSPVLRPAGAWHPYRVETLLTNFGPRREPAHGGEANPWKFDLAELDVLPAEADLSPFRR